MIDSNTCSVGDQARRKGYDGRRIRKLICMKSRLEATAAEIDAFRAEVDRTDTLLVAVGDLYAAGEAKTQDDNSVIKYCDHALVGYKQLSIILSNLNGDLARVLQRIGD